MCHFSRTTTHWRQTRGTKRDRLDFEGETDPTENKIRTTALLEDITKDMIEGELANLEFRTFWLKEIGGDTLAGVLERQVKGWILGERPEVTSAELAALAKRYIEEDSDDSEEDVDDTEGDVDLNSECK